MADVRTICAVSGTRADFGLLRWTLEAIRRHPGLALRLVTTGAHLDPAFGDTASEIEALGFEPAASVPLGTLGGSEREIGHALGGATQRLSDVLADLRPDMLLILGDRYEMLAAAQAATVARVPICHLHGGESTEGAIDEAIRHAITKMAHVHCVAAEPYARRVRQLGESPASVHVVGATGLDAIARLRLLDGAALDDDLGYAVGAAHLLVTFHPETLSDANPATALAGLLAALDRRRDSVVTITGANADAGGTAINGQLAAFAAQRPNVHFTPSLGQLRYLSLAAASAAVVGNSSSGLIEVPSLGVPTVNIGDRQRARLRAPSVIDCAGDAAAIAAALDRAMTADMRRIAARRENPYGEPGAAAKVAAILRDTDLDGILVKRFHDWPEPD